MASGASWWDDLSSFLEAFDREQGAPQIPGAPVPDKRLQPTKNLLAPPTDPRLSPDAQEPRDPVQDEPSTTAEFIAILEECGRGLKLASMKYGGRTRIIEPYSWKRFATGLRFYAFCHLHQHIELFDPNKIEALSALQQGFRPKWPVSLGQ